MMGFKERPICAIPGCNNPSLVFMLNRYFCGDCIAKWHKKQEEEALKGIMEDLK